MHTLIRDDKLYYHKVTNKRDRYEDEVYKYVPSSLEELALIIYRLHVTIEIGGMHKTRSITELFRRKHYFPNVEEVARFIIDGLPANKMHANKQKNDESHKMHRPEWIGQAICFDYMTMPKDEDSGHDKLLLIVEMFSCKLWSYACRGEDAVNVTRKIHRLIIDEEWDNIEDFHSDNGKPFVAKLMELLVY